jgi:hypothetical protein
VTVTVSFQIIWRLLFHAIWRMVRKTKGADWHDRPGFLVGICTEGRFGSLPAATAPPRTAKALEASGPRCGHCIPDGPAPDFVGSCWEAALGQGVWPGETCIARSFRAPHTKRKFKYAKERNLLVDEGVNL